jgi:hypothetical protein
MLSVALQVPEFQPSALLGDWKVSKRAKPNTQSMPMHYAGDEQRLVCTVRTRVELILKVRQIIGDAKSWQQRIPLQSGEFPSMVFLTSPTRETFREGAGVGPQKARRHRVVRNYAGDGGAVSVAQRSRPASLVINSTANVMGLLKNEKPRGISAIGAKCKFSRKAVDGAETERRVVPVVKNAQTRPVSTSIPRHPILHISEMRSTLGKRQRDVGDEMPKPAASEDPRRGSLLGD